MGIGARAIAEYLGRTVFAVQSRCSRMGLRRNRPWTTGEQMQLQHWRPRTMAAAKTELLFNRTASAIYSRRYDLKHQRGYGRVQE